MKPCKSHQRQIALLAVQGLGESERAAVMEHLRECPACRLYAEQLQVVVGLYAQDAERTVAPSTARALACGLQRLALPESIPWHHRLLSSRAPVLAAATVFVVCAVVLFMNRRPHRDVLPAMRTVATTAPQAPMVLSIGNSRHLTSAELEDLTRPNPKVSRAPSEFVFSVRTRDDGS